MIETRYKYYQESIAYLKGRLEAIENEPNNQAAKAYLQGCLDTYETELKFLIKEL